jgi:hypothetical protein
VKLHLIVQLIRDVKRLQGYFVNFGFGLKPSLLHFAEHSGFVEVEK